MSRLPTLTNGKTEEQRRALVRELNELNNECKALDKKLARMEAHEGEDGTPEDVDAQCALVDEIAAKRRRIVELRKTLYPK